MVFKNNNPVAVGGIKKYRNSRNIIASKEPTVTLESVMSVSKLSSSSNESSSMPQNARNKAVSLRTTLRGKKNAESSKYL